MFLLCILLCSQTKGGTSAILETIFPISPQHMGGEGAYFPTLGSGYLCLLLNWVASSLSKPLDGNEHEAGTTLRGQHSSYAF